MKIFLASYVILINLVGLILMGVDKRRARLHKRRIPERVLFLAAVLLGSAGILAGMYLFRHKTKKLRFSIGVPVILILQLAIIGLFGLWSSQRADCKIKSCEENGSSAEAVIRIQSINMSNVLADCKNSLTACAVTPSPTGMTAQPSPTKRPACF